MASVVVRADKQADMSVYKIRANETAKLQIDPDKASENYIARYQRMANHLGSPAFGFAAQGVR